MSHLIQSIPTVAILIFDCVLIAGLVGMVAYAIVWEIREGKRLEQKLDKDRKIG